MDGGESRVAQARRGDNREDRARRIRARGRGGDERITAHRIQASAVDPRRVQCEQPLDRSWAHRRDRARCGEPAFRAFAILERAY